MGYCVDIDECLETPPCDMNAICSNTDGSLDCTCNSGFFGNGYVCYGKQGFRFKECMVRGYIINDL